MPSLLERIIVASIGIFVALRFHFDYLVPLELGIAGFMLLSIWAFTRIKTSHFSLLPRTYLLLYAMPFTGLIGYIFSDQYLFIEEGFTASLFNDEVVLQTAVTIGLVGLCGLVAGLRPAKLQRKSELGAVQIQANLHEGCLSCPAFTFILLCALVFCAMQSGTTSIFFSNYGARYVLPFMEKFDFYASAFLGYGLVSMIMLDLDLKSNTRFQLQYKTVTLLATVLFIVVDLQLLRGDRESLGMVLSLMAVYLTRPLLLPKADMLLAVRKKLIQMAVVGSIVVLAFLLVGSLRETASESYKISIKDELLQGIKSNTWGAVLLNNVASAYHYQSNNVEFLWGKTYLDYILSLPPGFLCNLVGYERPVGITGGPTVWFLDLTMGGMQPAVVPFHNFGIFGTFLILYLQGLFIAWVDFGSTKRFWRRLLYAALFTSSFGWYWYGDMNIIRGLMIAGLAGLLGRALRNKKSTARLEAYGSPVGNAVLPY